MTKKFISVIAIVTVLIVVLFCSTLKITKPDNQDKESTSDVEGLWTLPKKIRLTEKVYYEKREGGMMHQSIYVESDSGINYIENDNIILRFTSINDHVIAYHANSVDKSNLLSKSEASKCDYRVAAESERYRITKDYFVIFDDEQNQKQIFEDQSSFNDYCEANGYKIKKWYFYHGIDSSTVELLGGWEMMTFDTISLAQQISKNGTVVYEGFVSEEEIFDNAFYLRLKVPERGRCEFIDSNKYLSGISDVPVGKQKTGILIKDDIYYDKYLLFDNATDEVKEFDSKKELKRYIDCL